MQELGCFSERRGILGHTGGGVKGGVRCMGLAEGWSAGWFMERGILMPGEKAAQAFVVAV